MYFVTLVSYQREELFGAIKNGDLELNIFGEIAREEWLRSPVIRPYVRLDAFQIMPNHLHGIVLFMKPDAVVGAHSRAPLRDESPRKPRSLGSFVSGYKSAVTARINALRDDAGCPVWQRNYHERIIRSTKELVAVRRYIEANPENWLHDEHHPLQAKEPVT
jgi:REP element-mobilizing transposase RayT